MLWCFLVLALLFSYLLYRHFTWQALPWPAEAVKPPSYQGHRGYWQGGERENTLASFRAAQQRGLQMIELDVRLSKEGLPVVFHDADLKRIGNSDKRVLDLGAEEMGSLVQAPLLEAVLMDPAVPRWINIETKTGAFFDGRLEKAIAEVVRKTQAEKRILFSSFNPLSLWRLSHHLPEVPRALLVTQEKAEGNRIYLRQMWLAPYVHLHALHLDYRFVTEEDLRNYKQRGIPVALWTVNEAEKADVFLKAGAFSIISDTLGEVPASSQSSH